jgi:hypothetical protein
MHKIKLQYPIDFEGRKLDEVALRRPKVSDMTRASGKSNNDMSMTVELTALLSGLPVSAIEDLDAADFKIIQETVSGFLE